MKFTVRSEQLSIAYSEGMMDRVGVLITTSKASRRFERSRPVIIMEPVSSASGRSIESRSVTARKPMRDGVAKGDLRSQVEAGGLDSVVFMPHRNAAEMGRILALGDVHFIGLIDNPLFDMTLPSKLQGTMASGCAIIGALSGDAADVIRVSKCGVVVQKDARQVASAITRFADNSYLLQQARTNALTYYYSEMSEAKSSAILIGLLSNAAKDG